jgi:hypothetical protein
LFVVATSDFEDVAFEFVSNGVSSDFLANLRRMSIWFDGREKRSKYPLVHESAQTTLIFDFNELLTAIGRIGDLKAMSAHSPLRCTRGNVRLASFCRAEQWFTSLAMSRPLGQFRNMGAVTLWTGARANP